MVGHLDRTVHGDVEVAVAKIGPITEPSRVNQAPDGLFQRFSLQLVGLFEIFMESAKTDAGVGFGDI